jgi:hypothetical protein
MVFGRNVIGELLYGCIQELDGHDDEQYSDHGYIPGRIWRDEEANRHCHCENDSLLAHRCFRLHTIDDPAP